jgi:hypothetical protein
MAAGTRSDGEGSGSDNDKGAENSIDGAEGKEGIAFPREIEGTTPPRT